MCQYANWLRYVWCSDLGIGTLRISHLYSHISTLINEETSFIMYDGFVLLRL